mmetsp:Transcript_44145/g.104483  ORF Transcript_44145/g.104483 Transcript_44145/m.104483 type:complete len:203 (-) Transcript_44145:277-885(-)
MQPSRTNPCGQGEHILHMRLTLPCRQGRHTLHLSTRRPCRHPLHMRHACLRFPCGQPFGLGFDFGISPRRTRARWVERSFSGGAPETYGSRTKPSARCGQRQYFSHLPLGHRCGKHSSHTREAGGQRATCFCSSATGSHGSTPVTGTSTTDSASSSAAELSPRSGMSAETGSLQRSCAQPCLQSGMLQPPFSKDLVVDTRRP